MPETSTCDVTGCGRPITLVDGRWADATRDPFFCPHSRDLTHRPVPVPEPAS